MAKQLIEPGTAVRPSPVRQNGPIPVLLMIRALGVGGSERQTVEMARALNPKRFSVRVGCWVPSGAMGEKLREASIPVIAFPMQSFASPALFTAGRALFRYLRRERIAVVHSFDWPAQIFATPVAQWAGTPLVLGSQRGHRSLTPSGWLHAVRLTDSWLHGIVANCEFLRQSLIEEERLSPDMLYVRYNGVDTSIFFPSPQERPEPLREASLVVGIVSQLRPEKDIATLVRAFARIRHLQTGLRLVMVGSGAAEPGLRALVSELGLIDQAVLVPATTQIVPWLRAIDIFVLPSRSEALSNAIMEAMATGCAVIASDVGGNPELVIPEVTGLLFPAGDDEALASQLRQLILHPERRHAMAAAGSQRMREEFSLTSSASRLGELYEALLARAAGPR